MHHLPLEAPLEEPSRQMISGNPGFFYFMVFAVSSLKFLEVCAHLTVVITISLHLSLGAWCDIGKEAMVSKNMLLHQFHVETMWQLLAQGFAGTYVCVGGGMGGGYTLNVWQIDIGKGFTNLDIEIVAKLTFWAVYTYIYSRS